MTAGGAAAPAAARLGAARRVRDLTVLPVSAELVLVVACDSVGGIGPKEADTYPVPAGHTAHFAARVPLLELLAVGAEPVLVVDTLCVERDPTGLEMIAAVRALAAAVGLDDPAAVTGSTEENVATRATGIGVTVIGTAHPDRLRPGRSLPGDVVACLGLPLSAPTHHLHPGHPGQVAVAELRAALAVEGVRDALPVGSRGVAAEAHDLAASAGLHVRLDPACGVDLQHSGGPASCVLVSCPATTAEHLRGLLRADLPVTVVGVLRRPDGAP